MLRRAFSSGAKPTQESALEILKKGFERMKSPDYRKSPKDLQELQTIAKDAGLSPGLVKQVYEGIAPGKVPNHSSQQKIASQARTVDLAALAPPKRGELFKPFEFDDLPSAGHLQLMEHRDLRQLVRVAAYELPQLSQYREAYRAPDKSMMFRFKTNVFLNESHPAEKKVVVTFQPTALGLKPAELHKLKLLAGPRYYPEKDEIKLACDRFSESAQNKRYLGLVINKLVETAKNEPDVFADVPLDPRPALRRQARHKPLYPKIKFPKEWNRPDMAPKPAEDIVSVLGAV